MLTLNDVIKFDQKLIRGSKPLMSFWFDIKRLFI